MAAVSLLNVAVRNNPAPFSSPYEFEITFECLEPLTKDLEWKLTYVGSATSSEHDQELDSLLVGPIPVGVNKFVFEADAPDLSRIPSSEIIGVTVILLACSYDGREFVRVGYYVNNEYTDEALIAEPPAKTVIEKVQRSILAEKPRVTRFAIKWDSEESAPAEYPPEQTEADAAEDDGAQYGAEEMEEEEAADEEGEDAEPEPLAEGEAQATATAPEVNVSAPSTKADAKADDAVSEAGSEDLEAESSGSEDEEEEEEIDGETEATAEPEAEAEAEAEADGDEKMTENHDHAVQEAAQNHAPAQPTDVMVH